MPDDGRMRFRSCYRAALTAVLLSQPVHAESPAVSPPAAVTARTTEAAPLGVPVPAGLSLSAALERFRRENLKLLAAQYEVSANRADVIAAGLLPNPRLSLDAYFHIHGEPNSAEREFSVELSQGLPLWGRLGASRDAAELTASASEREFAVASFQLLADVRRAYLSLQWAEAARTVLAAGLRDLDGVQRVLDARTAAGANSQYDRLRLELERGNLRGRVASADVAVASARADLGAAIGWTALTLDLHATDPLPEPGVDVRDGSALVRWAIEHRNEIAASRLASEAAEARLRAARRRLVPEPELGIGYSRWSGIPGAAPGSTGGALLASASIPLPVFDRGQGTIERHIEQSRAARVRERDQRLAIEREVQSAAQAFQLSSTAYQGYRADSSLNAESVRRIAELTYREGRGSFLELLDAYSSSLRVEEQALALRGSVLLAALALERALGPARP